jgi:hypothetical protein
MINHLKTAFVVPLVCLWVFLSYIVGAVAALLVVPSVFFAKRLYWACPFIPFVWRYNGWLRGTLMRLGFEATYCMNVARCEERSVGKQGRSYARVYDLSKWDNMWFEQLVLPSRLNFLKHEA